MPLNVNKEVLNTITGISNGDETFIMSFDTPAIDDIDEDPERSRREHLRTA